MTTEENPKNNAVPVNPLVEKLLANEGRPVELSGYIGPAEKGWVRIYSDLSVDSYLEIPEDAIIHVRQDANAPDGRCTIFFQGTAEVRYVTVSKLRLVDVLFATRSGASSGASLNQVRLAAAPGGGSGSPESPPDNCAIRCEMARNTCEGFADTESELTWCNLQYKQCSDQCKPKPRRPGGGNGTLIA